MGASAASWDVKTASPEKVAAAHAQAALQVRNPSGAIVFASGPIAGGVEAVARAIGALRHPFPVSVVAGSGVLTERGEVEEQTAAGGIVWAGGRTEVVGLASGEENDLSDSLARLLGDRTGKTTPTVLLFLEVGSFGPSTLAPLRDLRSTPYVFGGGSVGTPGAAAVEPGGNVLTGSIAMILRGVSAPAIRTTNSCRLLGPLAPITECRGSLLLEIDGEPALDVLARHGERLADRPLLLLVLAEEAPDDGTESGRPPLLVRGVQGIDPDRRALVVSEELRRGMRVGFAVRDPRAARDDMEAMTRELERVIAGAAPRFGIYVNCAGRGSGLYGAADVDTKVLRGRFPGIPFAGFASAFEIAPHLGRPALQLYSGVFALFTSPS
jgi:small ligand-binding sensory domain FIST